MKILVTGGNSRFARKLKELNGDKFITPSKEELNLLDKNSIMKFYEENKDIDGIIFNGTINDGSNLNEYTNWINEETEKTLISVFSIHYIATGLLIHLYKDRLKFAIGLSTGLIIHEQKNQCCPIYTLGKEILKNTIERFSYTDHLKHIKMFNLNPGGMGNDEQYQKHAIILNKIIDNIDKVESGIFDSIGSSRFNYEN